MQVLLNGELGTTEACTLHELCAALGLEEARIATAVNGSFVGTRERASRKLAPADQIEIVAPRQGG